MLGHGERQGSKLLGPSYKTQCGSWGGARQGLLRARPNVVGTCL